MTVLAGPAVVAPGAPDPTRDALAAFLVASARTPFAWGDGDCCLWLADWLVWLGRPDPAAHLRGRYRTELGCARVLKREGGVRAVVASCAAIAGLAPRDPGGDQAVAGDVGVIEVETPRGLAAAGGICVGRRWASRGQAGLVVAERAPLAVWGV